jgi:hypothetical protein
MFDYLYFNINKKKQHTFTQQHINMSYQSKIQNTSQFDHVLTYCKLLFDMLNVLDYGNFCKYDVLCFWFLFIYSCASHMFTLVLRTCLFLCFAHVYCCLCCFQLFTCLCCSIDILSLLRPCHNCFMCI